MRRGFVVLVLLVVGAAVGGCKENAAATSVCKPKATDSEQCQACCKAEGSNGYKWVGGVCGCLGG